MEASIYSDRIGIISEHGLHGVDPYGGMKERWVSTYSPSLKFSGMERESKSEMDYFWTNQRCVDQLRI